MISNLILLLLSISFIDTLPFKCGTDSLDDNYVNLNFIEINNKRDFKMNLDLLKFILILAI